MIHDVLLALLNPCTKNLVLEAFLLSDSVSTFIHPAENAILEKIIEIINIHSDILQFTQFYINGKVELDEELNSVSGDEQPDKSLYLEAFAKGVDSILQQYMTEISEMEKTFLITPIHSILTIYQKINVYRPILAHIQKLIHSIRSQENLRSCAIIRYLHQNKLHGNKEIVEGMDIVRSAVNIVFLSHLVHWLLYAKIVDNYGEFFIQYSSNQANNSSDNASNSNTSSGKTISNSISDGLSQGLNEFEQIWHYEIIYEYLPHFVSPTVAEKILFIGQTVLMFKVHAKQKENQQWNQLVDRSVKEYSIWNNKQDMFFKKIQEFENVNSLSSLNFEMLIDEVKSHVTKHLSEIAVNQGDLIRQLQLVRNYYLLGKGELYVEFARQILELNNKKYERSCKENKIRDIVNAYDLSAAGAGAIEELEIALSISKDDAIELDNLCSIDAIMSTVTLQHTIKWPLQLLFSPKVIQRYNELFRFLLHVKRLQYNLHYTWHLMRRDTNLDATILQLRQQFIFVVDNIQYYIQADILEDQFGQLMSLVRDSNDFEQIQRAHSVFQANILSSCFLLGSDTSSGEMSSEITIPMENPIFGILNEIFYLSDEFCKYVKLLKSGVTLNMDKNFQKLNGQLPMLVDQLMNSLFNLKLDPKLLFRLDFNHWFRNQAENKTND